MGAEWFCQMAGRELGPLSSQQIKMMAASGRLQPADSIRQGANGPWLPAARVKGLFPAAGNSPARKNGQQAPAAKKPASANPSANGTKRAGGGQAAAPRSARAIVVPARQPRQTQQPAAAPSPAADFFDELACGIPEPKKGFNVGRLAIDSTPVKVAGRKSSRVGGMNKAERTQMMRIMGGVIGGALVLSVIMVAIYLLRGSGPASAPAAPPQDVQAANAASTAPENKPAATAAPKPAQTEGKGLAAATGKTEKAADQPAKQAPADESAAAVAIPRDAPTPPPRQITRSGPDADYSARPAGPAAVTSAPDPNRPVGRNDPVPHIPLPGTD